MTILCRCLVVMGCFLAAVSAGAQNSAWQPGQPPVEFINADTTAAYPFSDAVRVGNILILSGVVGRDSAGKVVPGGLEPETIQIMETVRRTLERNGSSMDRIFKCTVMLADIKDWPAFNGIYRRYFLKNHYPARSAFAASALALGARVELEFWALAK